MAKRTRRAKPEPASDADALRLFVAAARELVSGKPPRKRAGKRGAKRKAKAS